MLACVTGSTCEDGLFPIMPVGHFRAAPARLELLAVAPVDEYHAWGRRCPGSWPGPGFWTPSVREFRRHGSTRRDLCTRILEAPYACGHACELTLSASSTIRTRLLRRLIGSPVSGRWSRTRALAGQHPFSAAGSGLRWSDTGGARPYGSIAHRRRRWW